MFFFLVCNFMKIRNLLFMIIFQSALVAGKTPLGAEQITLLWSKEYLEGHGPAVPLDIWLAKLDFNLNSVYASVTSVLLQEENELQKYCKVKSINLCANPAYGLSDLYYGVFTVKSLAEHQILDFLYSIMSQIDYGFCKK